MGAFDKEDENFIRLVCLLTEHGLPALRTTLHYLCTKKYNVRTFNEVLQTNETKEILESSDREESLTQQQLEQLYPQGGRPVKTDDLDWELCIVLLRNTSGLDEPWASWGRPPEAGDDSLASGLAQLNFTQNRLSESLSFKLSESDFRIYFKTVSDALLNVGKHIPSLTVNKENIETYKTHRISDQENKDLKNLAIGWVQSKLNQKKENDDPQTIRLARNEKEEIGQHIQDHLKESYSIEMAHLCVNPADQEETMAMEDMYVKLVWQTGGNHKGTGSKRLQSYTDIFGNFGKIFQGTSKPIMRILVQGKAGSGKTSLTQKIAYDWTVGDDVTLKAFENVFIISLRKVKPRQRLYSAIKEQLFEDEKKIGEIQLENYIEDNSNILLVFDGLDEITEERSEDFFNVVHRKRLRKVCVLITSVPWQAHDLARSNSKIDVHVTLLGFPKEESKTFISKFFANLYNDATDSEEIIKHTENLHEHITKNDLEEIAQIPLLLNMLCILYESDKSLPTSISKIYSYFIDWLFERLKNKTGSEDSEEGKERYMKTLACLGELGLDGLLQQRPKLYFTHKKILAQVGQLAFEVGLISTEKRRITIGDNTQYYFLHESFQEYTSAYYISTKLTITDEPWLRLKNSMEDVGSIKSKDMLLRFCAGASQDLAKKVLSFLDEKIFELDPDIQSKSCDGVDGQVNGKKSSLLLDDRVVELLEIEEKCLINMEEPLPCLFLSMRQLVPEQKNVTKASVAPKENGWHHYTIDSGAGIHEDPQNTIVGRGEPPPATQAASLIGHGAALDGKDATGYTLQTQDNEGTRKSTEQERTKYVFYLRKRLISKNIERMEGYEAMGIAGPPIKLEIVVSGQGKKELEKLLKQVLDEKHKFEDIMHNYLMIIETVDGVQLIKQALFPAIEVDFKTGEDKSQTVCIIVRERDQYFALTCNHDSDHTDAHFFAVSCKPGHGRVKVGTCTYQIKPSITSEELKSDEAAAAPPIQITNIPHVDVSAITLTPDMLREINAMLSDEKYEQIDDVFLPTTDQDIEICQLLGEKACKFGAGSRHTEGKIFRCCYNIKDRLENAILIGHPALEDNIHPGDAIVPQTRGIGFDNVTDPPQLSTPIQETNNEEPSASWNTDAAPAPSTAPGTDSISNQVPTACSDETKHYFTLPGDSGSAITVCRGERRIAIGMHLYLFKCINLKTLKPLELSVAIPLYDVLGSLEKLQGKKLLFTKSPFPNRDHANEYPRIGVSSRSDVLRSNNEKNFYLEKQSKGSVMERPGDTFEQIFETECHKLSTGKGGNS